MKIGFAQIFPFRPHPAHEAYLRHLVEQAGCDSEVFVCGGGALRCYNKALKDDGALECVKCAVGGSLGYWPRQKIYKANLSRYSAEAPIQERLLVESAGLLYRVETWREEDSEAFRDFYTSFRGFMAAMFHAAVEWIEKSAIDALVLFNGRQDGTAALRLAAGHCGIPYVTHERAWLGPGISLQPGVNCNSLKHVTKMVRDYDDAHLSERQARLAFSLVSSRFLQKNKHEWRLYNQAPEPASWPDGPAAGKRVLILPSSRCEFIGNAEYETPWRDSIEGLDLLLERLLKDACSVVIRCHPIWAQKIGPRDGANIEESYRAFAKKHGICLVGASSSLSTYDLIQQADAVVLNGGSSAIEAGFLGKQVIGLGPSPYMHAQFATSLQTFEDIEKVNTVPAMQPDAVCASTLRYVYTRYGRFPQYVDYVRPVETTRYQMLSGGDPERVIDAIRTQRITPDDAEVASSDAQEALFVQRALDRDLRISGIAGRGMPDSRVLALGPKWPLSLVHKIRPFFPMGDNR